jgi:predicted alpha/beta superfamily hydrolase
MFALYALFTKPAAFSRYVIGSPGNGVDFAQLEAEHHAAHGALRARVFLAAGGAELTEPVYAGIGVVSTLAMVCERLVTRGYPDLAVHANVYPGYTHVGIMPVVFADGLRWVYER